MDTSEKYIEMCRTATKLQETHTPCIGDWYFFIGTDPEDMVVCEGEEHEYDMLRPWAGRCDPSNYDNTIKKSVWLPLQCQLQDMIHLTDIPYGVLLIDDFYHWQKTEFDARPFKEHEQWINSWERLWLAYVMHKRYDKSWDGKNWIGD